MSNPIIALTPGDPASVGPELVLAVLQDELPGSWPGRLLIVGSHALLTQAAQRQGQLMDLPLYAPGEAWAEGPRCLDVPLRVEAMPGRLDADNAAYVLDTLKAATDGCLSGAFQAMVTGPVHKGIINDAGLPFTGHTEFLAERTGSEHVVMMLATESLRVALVTTHLPLAKVSAAIDREKVDRTIRILHAELRSRFGVADPRILVCGLNPHAGEGGHLGREDGEVIEPVVMALQQQGFQVVGPLPADTAFTPRALEGADAVVAMYHDQGLPVLKYAGFGQAVNVTLGLPIIRTSVDHGTALDIAGTGRADPGSLRAALRMACQMASDPAALQS